MTASLSQWLRFKTGPLPQLYIPLWYHLWCFTTVPGLYTSLTLGALSLWMMGVLLLTLAFLGPILTNSSC